MAKLEKSPTGYYQANQGFATVLDGEPYFIQLHELVPAGAKILKGREDLFEPALSLSRFEKEHERPEMEQATARPGEKRGG